MEPELFRMHEMMRQGYRNQFCVPHCQCWSIFSTFAFLYLHFKEEYMNFIKCHAHSELKDILMLQVFDNMGFSIHKWKSIVKDNFDFFIELIEIPQDSTCK